MKENILITVGKPISQILQVGYNILDSTILSKNVLCLRNRFKGLDLIDRVPDELWTEVHDIVQETGIKTIPMEKKCKKAEWLSEEGLQMA